MLSMTNRIAINSNLGKSIGNGTTSRYMSDLDGVGHYYTIPTVSLTGDFVIEVKGTFNTIGTNDCIVGQAASAANALIFLTSTTPRITVNNSNVAFTTAITKDGKLSTLSVKRVGNDFTLIQDGVDLETITDAVAGAKTLTLDTVGVSNTIRHFNGLLSDVKITDGTDLIRSYSIAEDLSTTSTIVDSGSDGSNGTAVSITSSELFTLEGADWLGAELVTNGNFATDTDWTKGTGWTIGSGIATYDGTGGTSPITNTGSGGVSGLTYKLLIDVIYNEGTQNTTIYFGDVVFNSGHLNAGSYEFIGSAIGTGKVTVFGRTGDTLKIDNITTKRILQAP